MSTDLQSPAFTDPTADAAIEEALIKLGSPGSFLDGSERLRVAEYARIARAGGEAALDLPPAFAEAAGRVAVEAMASRSEHLAAWEQQGHDLLAYVELVAVVAQISGIDSYRVALGAPIDPLPDPIPGEPVPVVDERAKKTNAWVPTVGIALAPTALTALPDESKAREPLSAAWYLTDEFVHKYDVEPGRELTRAQMELVAARTSWLNECFF